MPGLSFVIFLASLWPINELHKQYHLVDPRIANALRTYDRADEALLAKISAAKLAEQQNDWLAAFNWYRELYSQSVTAHEVATYRADMLRCLSQVRFHHRQTDAAYQSFVRTLKVYDALDLYEEVLNKLHQSHPHRDKVAFSNLFTRGKAACILALRDSHFREMHFTKTTTNLSNQQFLDYLSCDTLSPENSADARRLVYDMIRTGTRQYGLQLPAGLILEFLNGACQATDDYSQFTFQELKAPRSGSSGDPVNPTVHDVQNLVQHVGIGYLRISEFQEQTPAELDRAMASLNMLGIQGLIVDLRGNAGGSFLAGVKLASQFQGYGPITSTESPLPEFANRIFSSDSGLLAYDLPLVVLIDRGTMSAAEMVAAAWKLSNRAWLVGMTSFGKGMVMVQAAPLSLTTNATALAGCQRNIHLLHSIAEFFGPGKVPIEGLGVSPHIVEPDPAEQLRLAILKLNDLIAIQR